MRHPLRRFCNQKRVASSRRKREREREKRKRTSERESGPVQIQGNLDYSLFPSTPCLRDYSPPIKVWDKRKSQDNILGFNHVSR